MPEGNSIHNFAREHARDFGGRILRVGSPQGRFASEARRLDGRRFRTAEAYGKHLFHHWQGRLVVHVHLGMAGWFYRFEGTAPPPRPTVRMRLATRGVTVDLIGPPTCALISEEDRDAIVARLGPDPLRKDADSDRAWEALRRRPRPIGDALLDQRVVSGVGNIYRNEALFLEGLHPLQSTTSISRRDWEGLWRTLRTLMRRGTRRGSVRTVPRGEAPHPLAARERDEGFYVYRRERCRRCGRRLIELPLSGRRMFVCPREQRLGKKPRKTRPGAPS